MADYAKLVVKGIYSKSSDYSDPKVTFNPAAYALSGDEYFHAQIDADTGASGGEVIDTGTFAGGVSLAMVKNNDAATSVTVQFENSFSAAISIIVPAGGIMVTPDLLYTENLLLIAASGTVECEVLIIGT